MENKYLDINGNEMFPNDRHYLINALALSNAPYTMYGDAYNMKVNKEEANEWVESNIYSDCNYLYSWCVISDMKTGKVVFTYFNRNIK